MDHTDWTTTQEVDIPNDAAAAKKVIEDVLGLLNKNNWQEQDVFGVHLALEEAVVNAIKHGNQNEASRRVRIAYKLSPRVLRIEIEDEGTGFCPADVPDPTADENLEKPCGRGIMLMRNFMNRVDFNDQGNCVILEKTCD